MNASGTSQQAEHSWVTAHEHVRRRDFAAATREFASCFDILQALHDPRVPEVHRRWTETVQLSREQAAQAVTPSLAPASAMALASDAPVDFNRDDLEQAILVYENALRNRPDNEGVGQRLAALRAARTHGVDQAAGNASLEPAVAAGSELGGQPEIAATAATTEASSAAAPAQVLEVIAEDDFSDINGPEVESAAPPTVSAESSELVLESTVVAPAPAAGMYDAVASALATGDLHLDAAGVESEPADGAHDQVSPEFELESGPATDRDVHTAPTLVPSSADAAVSPELAPDVAATTTQVQAAGDDGRGVHGVDADADFGSLNGALAGIVDTAAPPSAPEAAIAGDDPRWGAAASPSSASPATQEPDVPAPDDLVGDKVALLEDMLVQVKINRRAPAA